MDEDLMRLHGYGASIQPSGGVRLAADLATS